MESQLITGQVTRINHRVCNGNTDTHLMVKGFSAVYWVAAPEYDREGAPNSDLYVTQIGDSVSFSVGRRYAVGFKNHTLELPR